MVVCLLRLGVGNASRIKRNRCRLRGERHSSLLRLLRRVRTSRGVGVLLRALTTFP
jgi:hypothetical protein